MRDALNRRFDFVLAESLDRFSRDQEDTAGLFKRLTFAGQEQRIHRPFKGEAAIVERIFREYVAGIAPKAIAKRLNRDGIAGPFGGTWSPSTIHGNPKRGTGVLNNELYIGRLIWNRLRYVKNPDTGKRISRLNPKAEWITKEIPSLRMVSDELWNAAKDRQSATRRTITRAGNIGFASDLSTSSLGCQSAARAAQASSWPAATVSHASARARRARAATTSQSDETKLNRGSLRLSRRSS
jgi:hypothetical protein